MYKQKQERGRMAAAAAAAAAAVEAAGASNLPLAAVIYVLRDAKPEDGVPPQVNINTAECFTDAEWTLLAWLAEQCGLTPREVMATPDNRVRALFERYEVASQLHTVARPK